MENTPKKQENAFMKEFLKEMKDFYNIFIVEFPIACKNSFNLYVGLLTFNRKKIKKYWFK